ncbi:preprotein translocase subunit SecE [Candidatus Falkowbacteria bacterium RIFOXYC2_FULL_47_12]|uniref:Protein translocase subunit SecE n=2 Tax=Candidatus Falkowiibacteriota TaxID=1752728 RepID=A0A1F5TLM3_9BACT|nr:MAG: preprotein translocase subunit SecE [Candidatus Falkowbacteria bacterium RIFOXYA2_FULL_47_9]OGF39833.1 MAG: preprotein translocase subunit SecE [Candidatus Falkowbacteria bacterium RIFOXYC2_FULL_47_12]
MFTRITTYVQQAWAEIKKVSWPTKKETKTYTYLVIGISLAVAFYLGALDYVFNYLLEWVLSR